MNSSSLLVVQQPSFVQPSLSFEVPPAVKRAGDIAISLSVGALGGYVLYWITRLVNKLGMVGEATEVIHPFPYILIGIVSTAVVESARLSYDIALHVLGKREDFENLAQSESVSTFDWLLQRTWKVIGRMEKLQSDIDVIFSRVFNIRTAKEIRENCIVDRDLYFMEISRRVFWEQISETARNAIPQELGVYIIEACGYTIVGGHLFIWLHGVTFLNGMIDKIGKIYQKIDFEQRQEELKLQQRECENKAYCDILRTMYPEKFATLDVSQNARELQTASELAARKLEFANELQQHCGSVDFVLQVPGPSDDFDPTKGQMQYKDVSSLSSSVFSQKRSSRKNNGELPIDEEDLQNLFI